MINRKTGLALPLVLWMIALLSIMASGFSFMMRTEIGQARAYTESVKAEAAAQAVVNYIVMRIRNQDPISNPFLVEEFTSLDMFGQRVIARLVPESSLIDLNRASRSTLAVLLTAAGETEDTIPTILDQLQDWRDDNDETLLNGAETEDYQAAGFYPGPRNAELEEIVELRQLPAVNETLYQKIAPYITVHGHVSGLNVTYAPAAMLHFLSGGEIEISNARDEQNAGVIAAELGVSTAPLGNRYRIEAYVVDPKGESKGYYTAHATLGMGGGFNVARYNAFKISAWQQSAAPQDIVEYAKQTVLTDI